MGPHTTPTTAAAITNATNEEFNRLITQLKELGVLRHSMLGDGWLVIYSEQGPMDITLERLRGNK
jgi:superoxide dismutase